MKRQDKWRHAEKIAQPRVGMIERSELIEIGFHDDAIGRYVQDGRLIRRHHNVYRLSAYGPSWRAELWAAHLALGPDSFFSHRTGARLLELDGAPDDVVEITAQTGRALEGVLTHRIRPTDQPRRSWKDGLPVAQVERVILDLAALHGRYRAGLALDDALRRDLTTLDRSWAYLWKNGRPGRDGTVLYRSLLTERDDRDAIIRTRFEKKMLSILRKIGRTFEPDFHVLLGGENYYLDFAYPGIKLGIECHSIRWHMGQEKWKSDVARDRRLRLAGWTILYFTWEEVVYRPAQVEQEIRLALQRAA